MKSIHWRSMAVAALALAVINLGFASNAQAGIVDTAALVNTGRDVQLAAVQAQLDRADVRAAFAELGVDPEAVEQRMASLDEQELASLAGQLKEAPAGGDVLALIGVVFVVLLVLELVGVIDIFKKIPLNRMNGARSTSSALVACLLLVLGGCAAQQPLLDPSTPTVELADTPFFPQERYQCGPASLAMVLGASGVSVTPEAIEPLVYLPGRKGSLQLEMLAAPRNFSRLAYRIDPELPAILSELNAGRPVLVLHDYGLPFWPRWHYAVAIGHDPQKDQILLRSGQEERVAWSARNFMRAWDNGERWAMVTLAPGQLPVKPDKGRYLEAAAVFERSATPHDAWLAFDAAVRTWPEEPVAWIGRGTAGYRSRDFQAAAADYRSALRIAPDNPGALNNLAMALLGMGCPRAARQQLDGIDVDSLGTALRGAVEDTRQQIESRPTGPDAHACVAG